MLKLNKDFQPQDETQLLTEVVIVEGIVFSLATPLEAYRDLTSLAVKKILFGGTPTGIPFYSLQFLLSFSN